MSGPVGAGAHGPEHRAGALIDRILAGVSIVLVAFLCGGISLDVLLRALRLGNVPWMLEASEYALFLLTFLGAPWVLRLGAHVRVDVVVSAFPQRAQRIAEGAGLAIALVVSGVLLFYSVQTGLRAHREGARVIKEFIFPEWWIFAVVSLATALMALTIGARLCRHLFDRASSNDGPVVGPGP